uniref:Uncharacterized protein n=1 Tax=Capra hircus TaxID=9925 RepID=A0A8C2NTV7_CAPHI
MSTLFSKKFTSTDSVRMEARICSNEMHQSVSTAPPPWVVATGLRASPPTRGSGAGGSSSSGALSLDFLPGHAENLFPTSPMRSNRLATVAIAWYRSCSMGSSLNICLWSWLLRPWRPQS